MEKRIELPDRNVFDEKSKAFFESKHAKRLQEKYKAKPYEEEYKLLYLLAVGTSWFGNGLSALSASTWLFTFIFSVVKELPYPLLIASVFTLLLLAGLELLQRFMATKFFRNVYQFGFKGGLVGLLMGMLIAAGTSLIFSYLGGFDLINVVTTPPSYVEPELLQESAVKRHYQAMIDKADKTAQDYFDRRKYKGRIATSDTQKYQVYLDKTLAYQDSLNYALALTRSENEQRIKKAEEDYQIALTNFHGKNKKRGNGLAGGAVVFILLFYLSIWYMEHYDFKTASQYVVITQYANSPTVSSDTAVKAQIEAHSEVDYQKLLLLMQQQIQTLKTQQKPNSRQSEISAEPGRKDEGLNGVENLLRMPVGFYSEGERQEQARKLFIQHIQPFKRHLSENVIQYQDKYTITHKNFKTGLTENLDFARVNNRVNIYIGKIEKSLSLKNVKVIPNQMEKLTYWISKREELLGKIKA